jgi:hypothetical protein
MEDGSNKAHLFVHKLLRKLGWDDDVRSEERREEPNEEFEG